MTAQFPDKFLFRECEYTVAGIHGDDPFDPLQFDLHAYPNCTACWRGYVATFTMSEDHLVLSGLSINLGILEEGTFVPQVGPPLNGHEPALPIEPSALFNNVYAGLDLPLPFTGGMLIARDFIRELYVHMGFHPAWKFREVWELLFTDGHLSSADDASQRLAELRSRLAGNALVHPKTKDHRKWIEDAFKLDY